MVRSPSTLRLIFGCLCIVFACVVGLWDYTAHQIKEWHTPCEDDSALVSEGSPSGPEAPSGPTDETLEIKRGDTLNTVLTRAFIPKDQIQAVIDAMSKAFNPRDLRTDHEIFITYNCPETDEQRRDLVSVLIKLSLDQEIIVERDDAGLFKAHNVKKLLEREIRLAEGEIKESLYVDAGRQGAHPRILHQMIQAFSYDVDFQRSFQEGDQYSLVFDYHKDPQSLQEKPGDLLYASLTLHGRKIAIYRFTPNGSSAQYFNDKGESVRKGLLRTPIDGARISSNYGHRKHPVLGYTKMHKGVDFAAPIGTPIMAAGDGKVLKMGRYGSYGNYIKIKHNAQYSTAYAHLCRFAKGLKVGSPVRQGQIIGYVGATGRVTGAHLHYELLAYDKHINPKHIKMLPAGKLSGQDLINFQAVKRQIDNQIIALAKVAPKQDENGSNSTLAAAITKR
jgi:murein DD-endopeptidase MepM/ murein hydrolase activator NlpD